MAKANLDRKGDMPRQSPEVRARNFEEVALGYTPDLAAFESQPLPELSQEILYRRLPGRHRYPRIHRRSARKGPAAGRPHAA